MYTTSFYIEPQDILNLLCEEDKNKFNNCIFSDVQKDRKGGLTSTLIEDKDLNIEPKCRYKFCSCDYGSIKLE